MSAAAAPLHHLARHRLQVGRPLVALVARLGRQNEQDLRLDGLARGRRVLRERATPLRLRLLDERDLVVEGQKERKFRELLLVIR